MFDMCAPIRFNTACLVKDPFRINEQSKARRAASELDAQI
jgi:hypothetical protein